MKSIVELVAERDNLKAEARAILEKGQSEQRRLDEAETTEFNALTEKIEAIDAEIEEREKEQNKLKLPKKMEEKRSFSLLKTIDDIVNNRALSDEALAVIEAGKRNLRGSGLSESGQIILPVTAQRADITVTASSGASVPVEVGDLFLPLRADRVLSRENGCRVFTDLKGDQKFPVLSGGAVAWATETGAAGDASFTLAPITLKPLRLTAKVPISKQMLLQDSAAVEDALMAELGNAVYDKLEATLLGAAAGTTTTPAGIFYGLTPTASVDSWAELVDIFAKLEVNKHNHYAIIASPAAKAKILAMANNDNTRLVYANGEVNGIPVYVTANVAANYFGVVDMNEIVIGQWGALDVTVDPYTLAANGEVLLVINAFFDGKIARANGAEYASVTTIS